MAHYSTKCVVFEIIVYRLDCLRRVLYRIRRRYREVVHCEYCVVLLVSVQPDMTCCAVVKVRGNEGERRSWAPKNCWPAFSGPTQPLVVQAG